MIVIGCVYMVALRKESVDRNGILPGNIPLQRVSLSARRAWIEILKIKAVIQVFPGRSPQGERG